MIRVTGGMLCGTGGDSVEVSLLSTSVAVLMLLAVVQDTDLVITYLTVVLATNIGIVLLHVVVSTYHRSMYSIGHVYIGTGQHPLLRLALGIIEVASTLFRAVSLSLRVVCNATAGHVLLAVLVDMTTSTVVSSLGVH